MAKRKIIVIGAGPAGMMAAGQAATQEADVLLLEKMKRPGRKLSITGKGRCNITNVADMNLFVDHFGATGDFLHQAFSRYFSKDLVDFLNAQGLKTVVERGGRVFPESGKAPDVTNALVKWVNACGVKMECDSRVKKLIINRGRVTGVMCRGRELPCNSVIIATGGASYPRTGSTGDGYKMAKTAGHKVLKILPALVPLETAGNASKKMEGLNLRNVNVVMYLDGKISKAAFGELVFAEFGVTGPVVLTLSGDVVSAINAGKKVEFAIDLKPALDEKKLDARLLRDFASRGDEEIKSILRGLLPKEMVGVCLSQTKISRARKGSDISADERQCLLSWLKDFRLEVTGYRPMDEAIVTAGGVDVGEINPKTMESKLIKGLYIVGELLDVNADTGGYNLQAAFSTGWLAGNAAAGKET